MPELPEVETTVRALKPKLEKSQIKTFELRNKNTLSKKFNKQNFKLFIAFYVNKVRLIDNI